MDLTRMHPAHIRVEKRSPLAIVTVSRPKVLNALNSTTLAEIDAALAALKADGEIRVILLTGSGSRAFAAGADIAELDALAHRDAAAFIIRAQETFRRMETLGKPIIALHSRLCARRRMRAGNGLHHSPGRR